jgi:hypothetical protein
MKGKALRQARQKGWSRVPAAAKFSTTSCIALENSVFAARGTSIDRVPTLQRFRAVLGNRGNAKELDDGDGQ